MTDQLSIDKRIRVRAVQSRERAVLIFKENPLFDYFSDDDRADSILLQDGKISLIGERLIDNNFATLDKTEFCISTPSFEFRNGKRCSILTDEWFQYPLKGEYLFIQEHRKKIEELIASILSDMKVEDSEENVSKSIRNLLLGSGYFLYYNPVVAFDVNTLNIWNKPGQNTLKKIMYIEVAARHSGLTIMYSNSFLATREEEYSGKYKQGMDALEILKKKFVEGNMTSDVGSELERFRNRNLYLTTPLYPFGYHPIPGPHEVIRTGDIAVFDLWNYSSDYSFRRKVVAIAGSYRAHMI